MMMSMPLTPADREILSLEKLTFRHIGNKEQRIMDDFGMTPNEYTQRLNRLIDTKDALAAEPLVVKRLRRLRATRQSSRAARRVGLSV